MLGWLFPRCPVQTNDKVWVERRMLWLASRFGIERLRNAEIILPTDDYFPADYRGDETGAHECFRRICRWMKIDAGRVSLAIVPDDAIPGAAGCYERGEPSVVRIAESQLQRPPALAATLAHELAHELLLNDGHLTEDVDDHERVTDLLPVFLGLGIFTANATVESKSWSDGPVTLFSISKQGYLSSVVLGHALAVFAFLRDDHRVPWAKHLRTDARVTLNASLRYLRRTDDSLLDPLQTSFDERRLPEHDILERLAGRGTSRRLAALWELGESDTIGDVFREPVVRCVKDADAAVQAAALNLFARFANPTDEMIESLVRAACGGSSMLQGAAVDALGQLKSHGDLVLPVLTRMLGSGSFGEVRAAADALAALGSPAATHSLLEALEHWAAKADDDVAERLAAAILAIDPDGRARIREHFRARDRDTRLSVQRAVDSLGA